jgi:hypothetical protein
MDSLQQPVPVPCLRHLTRNLKIDSHHRSVTRFPQHGLVPLSGAFQELRLVPFRPVPHHLPKQKQQHGEATKKVVPSQGQGFQLAASPDDKYQ